MQLCLLSDARASTSSYDLFADHDSHHRRPKSANWSFPTTVLALSSSLSTRRLIAGSIIPRYHGRQRPRSTQMRAGKSITDKHDKPGPFAIFKAILLYGDRPRYRIFLKSHYSPCTYRFLGLWMA